MVKRIKEEFSAVERYDIYKQNNIIHHFTAIEAVRYAFRFIKEDICCGIIVPNMNGVSVVMTAIVAGKYINDMQVVKERDDGFDFQNNVALRVIPKRNENIAPILLGRDDGKKIKIIHAKEGDPQMSKFKNIMGFD